VPPPPPRGEGAASLEGQGTLSSAVLAFKFQIVRLLEVSLYSVVLAFNFQIVRLLAGHAAAAMPHCVVPGVVEYLTGHGVYTNNSAILCGCLLFLN
jgi:hypothetical protein